MPSYYVYHTYERTDVYLVEDADGEDDAIELARQGEGECVDKLDGREFGIEAEEITDGNRGAA
jgi:hypothetical protein